MEFVKKNVITFVGIALGLVAGYFYYKLIGCSSGNCFITSKPVNSTLYGGLLGGLLFSLFITKKEKNVK